MAIGTPTRPGVIRLVAGTDQADNTEITETVPTSRRWRLMAFRAALVTDATSATRQVYLIIDDGTTTFLQIPASATHIASLTRNYNFAVSGALVTNATTEIAGVLPDDLILPAGYRIQTSTDNLQATDNYGVPQMLVEEWLE